jgi:hypothetical protein
MDCHLSATQPEAVTNVRGNVDPSNSTICLEVSELSHAVLALMRALILT